MARFLAVLPGAVAWTFPSGAGPEPRTPIFERGGDVTFRTAPPPEDLHPGEGIGPLGSTAPRSPRVSTWGWHRPRAAVFSLNVHGKHVRGVGTHVGIQKIALSQVIDREMFTAG